VKHWASVKIGEVEGYRATDSDAKDLKTSPFLRRGVSRSGLTSRRHLISMALAAKPGLAFPGGGLFFWWQAGAIQGLARRLDLSQTPMVGASAGALAATLSGCEVDMEAAFDSALRRTVEVGAFEKGPWGLYGIWGPIVHSWLDELLPQDAAERCDGRVNLLVRRLQLRNPVVLPQDISSFSSRDDLMASCMASVHVPFFLDGKMAYQFRGKPCVDGSLAFPGLPPVVYTLPGQFSSSQILQISPHEDPRMRERYRGASDFLRLSGEPALREMMHWGETYVDKMEEEGQFVTQAQSSDK
jgi:hypothetical protein